MKKDGMDCGSLLSDGANQGWVHVTSNAKLPVTPQKEWRICINALPHQRSSDSNGEAHHTSCILISQLLDLIKNGFMGTNSGKPDRDPRDGKHNENKAAKVQETCQMDRRSTTTSTETTKKISKCHLHLKLAEIAQQSSFLVLHAWKFRFPT